MAGVCDVCDFRALDNAPNVDDLLFESDQGVLTSPEVFHYVLAIQWLETARKKLENKFLDAYFASGALSASVSFDPYFLEDSSEEEEEKEEEVSASTPTPPSPPQSRKRKQENAPLFNLKRTCISAADRKQLFENHLQRLLQEHSARKIRGKKTPFDARQIIQSAKDASGAKLLEFIEQLVFYCKSCSDKISADDIRQMLNILPEISHNGFPELTGWKFDAESRVSTFATAIHLALQSQN